MTIAQIRGLTKMADKATQDAQAAILAAHEAREKRKAELKAKRDDDRAKLEGETKADAFKRIAVRRMNSALDEIAKLAPLSATSSYEYTDDQVAKIIGALNAEVAKVQTAFANKGVAKGGRDLGL